MSKIEWGLRKLRLQAAPVLGRMLSVREAAEGITEVMQRHAGQLVAAGERIDADAAKMGRVRLNTLELGGAASLGKLEALAICEYYGAILGRRISVSELMEYNPANNKRAFDLAVA